MKSNQILNAIINLRSSKYNNFLDILMQYSENIRKWILKFNNKILPVKKKIAIVFTYVKYE